MCIHRIDLAIVHRLIGKPSASLRSQRVVHKQHGTADAANMGFIRREVYLWARPPHRWLDVGGLAPIRIPICLRPLNARRTKQKNASRRPSPFKGIQSTQRHRKGSLFNADSHGDDHHGHYDWQSSRRLSPVPRCCRNEGNRTV